MVGGKEELGIVLKVFEIAREMNKKILRKNVGSKSTEWLPDP